MNDDIKRKEFYEKFIMKSIQACIDYCETVLADHIYLKTNLESTNYYLRQYFKLKNNDEKEKYEYSYICKGSDIDC